MRLGTRMALYGAVFPAAMLIVSYLGVGLALDHVLHEQIDQALLTQAAVESVSLFDQPDGRPHLHLATSPLAEEVAGFAAVGALYDDRGALVLQHPAGQWVPERAPGSTRIDEPRIRTDVSPGGAPLRVLQVTVAARDGRRYLLWLGAPLTAHANLITTYYQTGGALALVAVALLLALALRQSRMISRRLEALAGHMERLREGDFGQGPPEDGFGDTISELRDAIAEATVRLRASAESRDRFIADAAHELRSPLAAIRAGIDVTLRRERDPAELRDALDSARREVDRLAQRATALLELAAARRTAFDRRPADVRCVVEDAVEAARFLAEERDLLIELDPGPPLPASIAEDQVRQAVDNLLSNAMRHAPTGSRVEVSATRDAETFCIRVRDHGAGVAKDERERVFEPFHRAGGSSGAGIGLAIVREVARRHGGEARLEPSGERDGASFLIELPSKG